MPSATASHSTTSSLQPFSSRRSAAARSVGSTRGRGPGMSPSQDRASSYVGPPFVKCAAVSRVPPSSGGSHRTVAASHPHVCICVARSMLGAWSTRRGGRGALRSEDTSLLHPVRGSGAACSHSVAAVSHGRSGTAPQISVVRGRVCSPHPSSRMAAYCAVGVPDAQVVAHHGLHLRAHSTPTMCASHAVRELRPMIHCGKSAPRR